MATPEPRTISIVIPCYNAREFLPETLDSVFAQSYPRVEVVVVDDGSTDGSGELIRSYGPRIRAVHTENGGISLARSRGLAVATGEAFVFLDADDLLSPDALEGLAEAQAGRDDVLAACPWRRLRHEGGAWVERPAEIPFPLTDPDPIAAWLKGEWIPGCSVLWPRALFDALGGYDPSLTSNEDGDLMFRAFVSGARLVVARRGVSYYRSHGTGRLTVSQDVFAEHRFRSRMRVFEKLERTLREKGEWERYVELVGLGYLGLAQRTFPGRPDLAREALARGEAYAGRVALSPTLPGRILVRLLGMERKERLANALARLGIMTPKRREIVGRAPLAEHAGPRVDVSREPS